MSLLFQPNQYMCTDKESSDIAHGQPLETKQFANGSFRIFEHIYVESELSDYDLNRLCGYLARERPSKESRSVEPIPETRFELNLVPNESIVKLSKKKYVDAFFDSGQLQLGSFIHYAKFDHNEIGDNQEGITTLLAKTSSGVIGGTYGSGFNQYVFCTSIGDTDHETMEKFGYDDGFIINDPEAFSKAIAKSIGARAFTFGRCVYHSHKAVLGFPKDADVNSGRLSHESGEIVTSAKYFIKPERYSHQKEFRFLWETSSDINDAKVFDCSSAIQYCSRLDI